MPRDCVSFFSLPCSSGSPPSDGFGEARLPLSTLSEFLSPLSEAGSVISQSRSSEVDHCFHLAQQSQTVSVVEVHEETFHYKSPHAMGNKIDLLVLMKDSKLKVPIPTTLG